MKGHGKEGYANAGRSGKRVERGKGLLSPASVQESRIVTKRMLDGSVKRYTEVRKAGE